MGCRSVPLACKAASVSDALTVNVIATAATTAKNCQPAGRSAPAKVAADTMVKSVGSEMSILDNRSLF